MIIVSPKMLEAHDKHIKMRDLNHSWMCWYEKCPQYDNFIEQVDKEYDRAKALCKEKLGDTWDNIPLEDRVVITIKAIEFL